MRFDRLNLNTRILLGLASLVATTLVVAAAGLSIQSRAVQTVDAYLDHQEHVGAMSARVCIEMLEARLYEKAYLDALERSDSDAAAAQFGALLKSELDDARGALGVVARAGDATALRTARELLRAVDGYEQEFGRLIAMHDRLGHGDSGIAGELARSGAALEQRLVDRRLPGPLVQLLAARRAEKSFILHGGATYAGHARALVQALRGDRELAALPAAAREAIDSNIQTYLDALDRYVTTAATIDEQGAAHERALARMQPLVSALRERGASAAQETRDRLGALNAAFRDQAIGAALGAIALALIVAWFVARNVNATVGAGVAFAQRLTEGDLTARLIGEGDHDFGRLARALNGMADDLRARRLHDMAQEAALRRYNRALQAVSRSNGVLVRATTEGELLQAITQQIAETAGYSAVWVGYPQDDPARTVKPIAAAGPRIEFLDEQGIRWSDDDPRGRGATGTAIREGRTVIIRDIANEAATVVWRDAARRAQFASVIALPLRSRDCVFGALVIFAAEADAFNADEVSLLEELASNLAFGVVVQRDNAARRRLEAQVAYHANHDVTTGLVNRHLLKDRLDQALVHAAASGGEVAVVKLALDRFATISDTHGHDVADRVVTTIADRLSRLVDPDATLARTDSDAFALAIPDADASALVRLARELIAAASTPIEIDEQRIHTGASVGIGLFPRDAHDSDALIQSARAALVDARAAGAGACRFFSKDMNERTSARVTLEAELRTALERGEFLVHFQPKASLRNGRVTGAEALVRWQHSERGLVPPAAFIPVAEDSGLIEEIGAWVLREVCRQLAQWRRRGIPLPKVSVNLSARQFRQENLAEQVRSALVEHGVEPGLIELELTESAVMDDVEQGIRTLKALRALGVGVSLDDFGTGHSSLSYLKRLPITQLKIDQSFVREITADPDSAAICRAVIGVAHSLKLTVIAEGVETEGQLHYLKRQKCDEVQGYYFSAPLPADDFARLLSAGRHLAIRDVEHERGTLLLVDDEPFVLSSLRRALRNDGYTILSTSSPHEAFEILATQRVDVVISDQRMPQMNGTEFLARVSELYPDTVRIVLSGYTDVDSILEAINRGTVFRFLTKPWEDDALHERVREAFRFHGARRQRPTEAA